MNKYINFFQKLSIRNWVWVSLAGNILAWLCLLGATSSMMYIFALTLVQIANILLLGALVVYALDDTGRAKSIMVALGLSFLIVMLGIIQCFNSTFSWILKFSNFTEDIYEISEYYHHQNSIYQLIQNLVITIALACGVNVLNTRYRWPYFLILASVGLTTLGFILEMTETFIYEELFVFNSIAGISMFIAMIVLLFTSAEPTAHNKSFTEKSQQLFKLNELKNAGVLSKEEFDVEKNKILNQ